MGDITDDLIDRLYDEPPDFNDWDVDNDDSFWPNDDDGFWPSDDRTCRVCGQGRLRWGREGNRWRLFDMSKGKYHECPGIDPTKFFPNLEHQ